MQRPKQNSVLDKFRQDFRNYQILGKYDKSSSVPQQQQSFLRTLPQILARVQKILKSVHYRKEIAPKKNLWPWYTVQSYQVHLH